MFYQLEALAVLSVRNVCYQLEAGLFLSARSGTVLSARNVFCFLS
jgi:hypothetical protein